MKKYIGVIILLLFSFSATGCGYLLAGGAGAAGGYVLRDKGYVVQSPVKKEGKAQSKTEKKNTQDSQSSEEKTNN